MWFLKKPEVPGVPLDNANGPDEKDSGGDTANGSEQRDDVADNANAPDQKDNGNSHLFLFAKKAKCFQGKKKPPKNFQNPSTFPTCRKSRRIFPEPTIDFSN